MEWQLSAQQPEMRKKCEKACNDSFFPISKYIFFLRGNSKWFIKLKLNFLLLIFFKWLIYKQVYFVTRLKCKSSARVKIVLKKDWIVKNVEKM